MAVASFDIGKLNLACCVRAPPLEGAAPAPPHAWFLVDLVAGKAAAYGAAGAEVGFEPAGKRPSIADCVRALWAFLATHLDPQREAISAVVVEAQMGRSNVGCKVLSHAIQCWATDRGLPVEFRRPFAASLPGKPSYAQRKKIAVETAREQVLMGGEAAEGALAFFEGQRKKDDLADSWLLAG